MGGVDAAVARLVVSVEPEQEGDAEHRDAEVRLLRDEILESEVQDAFLPVEGSPPPGARAVDAETVGQIVVTVVSTAQALSSLARVLADWLDRRRGRRLVLEFDGARLELDNAPLSTQRQILEAFLSAHSEPPSDPGPDQP